MNYFLEYTFLYNEKTRGNDPKLTEIFKNEESSRIHIPSQEKTREKRCNLFTPYYITEIPDLETYYELSGRLIT